MAGMVQDEAGAILAIRGHVQSAREELQAENARVVGQIDGWRPSWKGEGSKSFEAFKTTWTDRFNQLMASLNEFEGSLQSTNTTFQSTDSDAGSQFTGLTSNVTSV